MKRCVLRFLLNESTEGEVLSSDGSEFHQVGPMEQNARSPYVTDRVIGTFSSMPAERRPGLVLRYWIRSWRYWGAGPCSVLYTSSVTLYCIRDVIGSQWSSRRTGVIWSYLRVPVRRRAPLPLISDVEDPKSALPTVAVVLIHDLPRLYMSHVTHAILPINLKKKCCL